MSLMNLETGSKTPKRVRLLKESTLEETIAADTETGEKPLQNTGVRPSPRSDAAYHGQILAMMQTMAMILSARSIAILAVIGSFVLALLSVIDPDMMRIYLTLGFDVFVLIPAVVLYLKRG